MSDSVVSFADRLAQRRAISDDDPRANEEKLRVVERMKLREIQKSYGNQREGGLLKWKTPEDMLRAAQALGRLIEKASKPAAGKSAVTVDIMKKKWRADHSGVDGASEFHIDRYRIKPEIDLTDPQVLSEHAKKIKTRSVVPYANRARFVAKLAELDPDESEIDIFRNTSHWRSPRGSSPTNNQEGVLDEAADKVAFLLEELSGRVIRESALADVFSRMRRIPGQWDIRTRSFRASSMACLFRTAYQDSNEHWTEAPPLPSVTLVRLWYAGLSIPVRLSNKASTEPIAAHAMLVPVTPEEGEERSAELHIYREIRLALGPTVNADALGPMFESRVFAELRILDDDGKISGQGVLDPESNWNLSDLNSERSVAVLFDDRWHRVTPLTMLEQPEDQLANMSAAISGLHVESPFMWDHTPLAEEKQCFELNYFSWTSVDAPHVAHWLDHLGDGQSQPVELLPDACEPKSAPDTWYPRHVLAHVVEKAIYDGSLEAALQADIARIRKAFKTHETEWRNHMQEQTAELIAEIRSDLQTTAMPLEKQTENQP